MPGGTYFAVVASDSPSTRHPAPGERDSTALKIKHRQSSSSAASERGRRTTRVRINDADSPVARVSIHATAAAWTAVFPKDGIADSKTEHYELILDGDVGENGITIRASDSMNNTDTTHVAAPRGRR